MSRYLSVILILLGVGICVESSRYPKPTKRNCINLDTSLCDGRIEDDLAELKIHTTNSIASLGSQLHDQLLQIKVLLGGENADRGTGEFYELRLTPRSGNFDEARVMCNEMGGKLAQRTLIKNIGGHNYESEYRRLMELSGGMYGSNYYWIGISDRLTEGKWMFLSDETFPEATDHLIADWLDGEPNDGAGWYGDAADGEDCGHLVIDDCGQSECPIIINDVNCTPSASHRGICEIDQGIGGYNP